MKLHKIKYHMMNVLKYFLSVLTLSIILTACKEKEPTAVITPPIPPNPTAQITKIAFGSCSKHDEPQPMWSPIIASQPDLWIWLGDAIYGDTENMDVLKSKYDAQSANSAYGQLTQIAGVIGTWDDHDYGKNNGGKEYPKKAESKELFLDFLKVSSDAPERQRDGVYSVHTYGTTDSQKVKVILLDARYFRDAIGADNGKMLGEAQWTWLENELTDSDAAIHIIGSGIQILSAQHQYEKWNNFPVERQRLFDVLVEQEVKGAILVSGDRHIGEFSKIDIEGLPYPLYDVTASGLTHSWDSFGGELNALHVGDFVTQLHFGLFTIDWEASPLSVKTQLIGEKGQVYEEVDIVF